MEIDLRPLYTFYALTLGPACVFATDVTKGEMHRQITLDDMYVHTLFFLSTFLASFLRTPDSVLTPTRPVQGPPVMR